MCSKIKTNLLGTGKEPRWYLECDMKPFETFAIRESRDPNCLRKDCSANFGIMG